MEEEYLVPQGWVSLCPELHSTDIIYHRVSALIAIQASVRELARVMEQRMDKLERSVMHNQIEPM